MKVVVSLDGAWKLKWFEFGRSEGQFSKDYDDSWWLDAKVPGEVHEELLKRGLIEDPFYASNCDRREWVERVDWWYRKRFFVPKELQGKRVELVFEGLDTFATVWLNGVRVAESEDMFLPLRVDVSDKLEYGGWNVIAVRLGAPWYETLRRAGGFSERTVNWNGSYARLYARKAQYQYGWDWAVKLLTVGIWRSVRLEAYDKAVIRDAFVWTRELRDGRAILEVWVDVESLAEFAGELVLEARCGDSLISAKWPVRVAKGWNEFRYQLEVENPKLWWPRGYGPQNLYEAKVALLVDGEREDERSFRFGIRTVEHVTHAPITPNGRVFFFRINGVPVFLKGANWIPADLLISRITRERYRELLELAVEGNHNALRVWGGGLVEYDDFYDLCDELGILLWHDFQFACGHYPEDEKFLALVEKELEATVRRLRNHPSIILWCGNNEDEVLEFFSGFGVYRHRKDFEVAPRVVSKLDPSRPYWPSSPWGDAGPTDSSTGDAHNWLVWHGMVPIEDYLKDESRFLSEFGMQAAPHVNSLRRFLPPEKLWPINELWVYHYHVPDKMIPYLRDFGDPRWLLEYVFLTQLVQAEALRTAIEHARRRKFACGGALYWSFNAPWPNMCWETVDYYGRPKMGFYAAKRAFAPVLVSPLKSGEAIDVYVVNDLLTKVSGTLTVRVVNVGEHRVVKELRLPVSVEANASSVVARLHAGELVGDPAREVVHFTLEHEGGSSRNVLLLARPREVSFAPTELELSVKSVERGEGYVIVEAEVSSRGYARLAHVDVVEDYVAIADDNYFDLLPGEKRTVKLRVKGADKSFTLLAAAQNARAVTKVVDPPPL
ncbi:MAG: glycoside hydrolase family 2 protein [Thermofilaceae archaeon]